MKSVDNNEKARIAAWIVTGIAVVVGVCITGSALCMWALFIPVMY